VASSMTLRIVRRPETVQVLRSLPSIRSRRRGRPFLTLLPRAFCLRRWEIMDRLSIQAAEAAVHPHYPECDALLLVGAGWAGG